MLIGEANFPIMADGDQENSRRGITFNFVAGSQLCSSEDFPEASVHEGGNSLLAEGAGTEMDEKIF